VDNAAPLCLELVRAILHFHHVEGFDLRESRGRA